MASQLVATSGNKRLKRDQIAELEAKMGSLKDIQAQKAQREMHRDTMRFKAKEFQQQKKQSKKTQSKPGQRQPNQKQTGQSNRGRKPQGKQGSENVSKKGTAEATAKSQAPAKPTTADVDGNVKPEQKEGAWCWVKYV